MNAFYTSYSLSLFRFILCEFTADLHCSRSHFASSRWEIEIQGVFFNGQKLADSTQAVSGGVDNSIVSALIDTVRRLTSPTAMPSDV